MEIRKVQKTGNMHYLYLPTSWCKKHKITADTNISINQLQDGTLSIIPKIAEQKEKSITLKISEDNPDIIHKLIIACYINPASSFKIIFENEIKPSSLLDQKRLISLENVEIDNKHISCESDVTISDPASLLRTMSRKIKNLLALIISNYDEEIITRYEDEIDKSKLLIDKCVISAMTFSKQVKMTMIELYYISIISRELERIVDNIILLDKKEKVLIESCAAAINSLNQILEATTDASRKTELDILTAIDFIKKTLQIKTQITGDSNKARNISNSFINIADVITDWAITNQIESRD